jgi:hypothetical protein
MIITGRIMSDSKIDIVKTDKSMWPRTTDGTIDWTAVFEDEMNGLIPAIRLAQKNRNAY